MTGNLTQAVAIPSLMGGSAYKGSVRYNNKGGLHTINSLLGSFRKPQISGRCFL